MRRFLTTYISITSIIIINFLFCFVLALNDEQKKMQELARKFAREEILPKAAHYDKTGEVRGCIGLLADSLC